MVKYGLIALLMLSMGLSCVQTAPQSTGITLAADAHTPVLILSRTANFREYDARCGTEYRLYADGMLDVYALIDRSNTVEAVRTDGTQMTQADYLHIERLLGEANIMDMPDSIPNDILDGDTVTLALWTAAGRKTITSQSPNGLPFGSVVSALEKMFRRYEDGGAEDPVQGDWGDCMPPEPTYTPGMPEYHSQEGSRYYGQGEYEKAVAAYEASIALDPLHMHGYYGLAMTYRAMGLLQLSIENYTAVMAIEPDYAQPYASRAQIYQFLGRYEEAEADLNQYVGMYGQYPVPYIDRGDFYMTRGEYRRAAEDYGTALEKRVATSALAGLYLKRAEARLKLGDADGATADFNAALSHMEPAAQR